MKTTSLFTILAFVLMGTLAPASTTTLRQVDNIVNSTGGATIATPSVGTAFLSDTSTNTVTNKTMSGASNSFSAIPVSSIGNGSVLSGSNTGDVTIGTSNGLSLAGQALSLQLSTSGQNGALSSTDWSTFNGKLTSPLTTKGDLLGFSTVNARIPVGSNDQVLTADSTQTLGVKWATIASGTPTVNASQASPQSVSAAGGISLSTPTYSNFVFVVSNSGSVTVTATPSITACTAAGQTLVVVGESATNKITLQDEAGLTNGKLHLNGNWTSGLNSSLSLYCDGNGFWNESGRY